jgi:hypothetical protein
MSNTTESPQISFDDGKSFESLIVTQLNTDEFRLEETPLLSETIVSFGDVIRTEKHENGGLIFRQVISKAKYQTYHHLASQQLLETPEFKALCESILQLGGMWELALGGIFIVHVPHGIDFDVLVEIDKISQNINRTP